MEVAGPQDSCEGRAETISEREMGAILTGNEGRVMVECERVANFL